MYQSELDIQYANQRQADYVTAARIRRLIRQAQAAEQPAAPAARRPALIVRLLEALRPQRTARV